MSVYYSDEQVTLHLGDALEVLRTLPDESVDCVVTSPPYYGLRDYGTDGQYGLEDTPAEYVETMRAVFAEAKRVLAKDGTCWINVDDSYAGSWGNQGHKDGRDDIHVGVRGRGALPKSVRTGSRKMGEPGPKNLYGIPWRLAFAMQDDGWILRNEIVWEKPNAMPESVADRLATRHEKVFLFASTPRYWFDLDAIREPASQKSTDRGRAWGERKAAGEPMKYGTAGLAGVGSSDLALHPAGRNPGDVWSISTRPFPEAHFATFPIDLPIRCIKAGCKPGGTVLDPFSGSGTTGGAARLLGRKYVGIDLSAAYHDLAKKRFAQGVLDLGLGEVA